MSREAGDERVGSGGPAFDLVLATIGRTTEVARFLDSLAAQTWQRFRVILVDQNPDDRLEQVVAERAGVMAIDRVESQPGLSRARNVALQHLTGDVVAFPDDDCLYPPDLLAEVGNLLDGHADWDGLTGRTVDETGGSSFLVWRREPALITRKNVWQTAVATTIFLRRPVVDRVGQFDDSLGAGSGTEWGSGEETDYVLRALEAGFRIRYDPAVSVVHASPQPDSASGADLKAYLTGMGNSRVLRKHGYSSWFAAYRVLQLLAGSLYFLARGRVSLARFYATMARGRIKGWLQP
jgi:GT2 family glycosyltransferase